eukprot:SAG31_NODE_6013_length_2214_cov_3.029314_2_plen_125_part_00
MHRIGNACLTSVGNAATNYVLTACVPQTFSRLIQFLPPQQIRRLHIVASISCHAINVTDGFRELIANGSHLVLSHLHLEGKRIGRSSANMLQKASLPSLCSLVVKNTKLDDAGILQVSHGASSW